MGRRTTSTTKGGKFMNPTDQARKEARRRELKRNKRQRMAVRQAVIKTKDPQIMVKDLEELDDMELNPGSVPAYNEKVVKEKRRKLLEALIRTVDFYCKEDPSRGRDFKIMIEEYKQNRKKKESYHESVKNAQQVEIGAIPLPDAPFAMPHLMDIPLPGVMPQSILKKQPGLPPGPPSGLPPTFPGNKNAPGPPPGQPPAKKVFVDRRTGALVKPLPKPTVMQQSTDRQEDGVDDDDDDDGDNDDDPYDPEEGPDLMMMDPEDGDHPPMDDDDDDEEEFHHRDDDDEDDDELDEDGIPYQRRRIRFADENPGDDDEDDDDGENDAEETSTAPAPNVTPLQAMMLKMAGQKVPSIGSGGRRRGDVMRSAMGDADDDDDDEVDGEPLQMQQAPPSRRAPPGPPPGLPPGPPPGMPPSLMKSQGILPPGPPPGLPPGPPPGMPQNRPAPVPPPQMVPRPEVEPPPQRIEPPPQPPQQQLPQQKRMQLPPQQQNPNVLSAPPSLIHRPATIETEEAPAQATIVAKPQLTTQTKGDSTRFMPTSLRVRREAKKQSNKGQDALPRDSPHERLQKKQTVGGKSNADQAYDSFMKEMRGLL